MLKNIVILVAAAGLMTACNDSKNKKAEKTDVNPQSKKEAPAPTPAQEGDVTQEEGDVDTTELDKELTEFILGQNTDWCSTKDSKDVTAITVGGGSMVAIEQYRFETAKTVKKSSNVVRAKVKGGQLVLTQEVNTNGAMETKTGTFDVRIDGVTELLVLTPAGDMIGSEVAMERCTVSAFNAVDAE